MFQCSTRPLWGANGPIICLICGSSAARGEVRGPATLPPALPNSLPAEAGKEPIMAINCNISLPWCFDSSRDACKESVSPYVKQIRGWFYWVKCSLSPLLSALWRWKTERYDRLDIWITRYISGETILFSRDLVKAYTLHMSGGGTVQWWQCVASFSARWSVTAVASVTSDQCPVLGWGPITGANNYTRCSTASRDILHLQSYSAT